MSKMVSLRNAAESYLMDAHTGKGGGGYSQSKGETHDAGDISQMTAQDLARFGVKKG